MKIKRTLQTLQDLVIEEMVTKVSCQMEAIRRFNIVCHMSLCTLKLNQSVLILSVFQELIGLFQWKQLKKGSAFVQESIETEGLASF